MTEDRKHKENMIKIGKGLIRHNRYLDILPCKKISLNFIDQNNLASISEDCSCLESFSFENYVNASYIEVIPYNN